MMVRSGDFLRVPFFLRKNGHESIDSLYTLREFALVDGAWLWYVLGLEGEGAEGLLVLGEVVAEDVPEGLGLLGAKVDTLEVAELDLVGCVLGHGAEDEEEVPDTHADLHAVGVAVAVVLGGSELEGGLVLIGCCGVGGLAH